MNQVNIKSNNETLIQNSMPQEFLNMNDKTILVVDRSEERRVGKECRL